MINIEKVMKSSQKQFTKLYILVLDLKQTSVARRGAMPLFIIAMPF